MAADGLITLDFNIKTSGDTKSLESVNTEINNLNTSTSLYNQVQSETNNGLNNANMLVNQLAQGAPALGNEMGVNLPVAMQSFIDQSGLVNVAIVGVATENNEKLIPSLDTLLDWTNTNMPTIDQTMGNVLSRAFLLLTGIGAIIPALVIPQLTGLLDWLKKNSTEMNEKFTLSFKDAKDTIRAMAGSMKTVNEEFDKLKTNAPNIKDTIQGIKDKFSGYDAMEAFGGVLFDIGLAIVGICIVTHPMIALLAAVAAALGLIIQYANHLPQYNSGDVEKAITYDRIGKFATGTPYLPNDMIALVHEGEMIVPKSQNPYAGANRIKSAMNVNSADRAAASNSVSNVTYTFNSPKALGMSDVLREMRLAEQRKVLLGV